MCRPGTRAGHDSEVKWRFAEEVVAELLGIRWWDWGVEKISANIGVITRADVEALKAAGRAVWFVRLLTIRPGAYEAAGKRRA